MTDKESEKLRDRSGAVESNSVLTAVIYDLIRDHVSPSVMEEVIRNNTSVPNQQFRFTNGWLASYADDLSNRIRGIES